MQPRTVSLPHAYRSMTMAGAVRTAAARAPGKTAIRHGAVTRTYQQLIDRLDRITNAAVRDLKIVPGRNTVVIANNCIEYLELTIALPEAGVAVATVSQKLTPTEAAAVCDDAEAEVLFVDAAAAKIAAASTFKTVKRIIEIGPAFERWIEEHGAPIERPRVDEWQIWTIPYTSGTTGKPKGVMLSHRARILNYFAKAVEYGCFGSDDRFLSITPMSHGPGIGFPMNILIFGGFVEIMDKFDPPEVLRKLKEENFTGIYTVPTHFHAFFELDKATLDKYRRPPNLTIISNSAPLTYEAKIKIVEYFGEGVLHELYSSTETAMVTNIRPADQIRKPGSCGLPFAFANVKILADDGRECGVDEVGEVFANSPYLFSGYWNRPEETAAAFKDGWVSAGDLAKKDSEGYLYIVGRKKEMIITGGINVYPIEIEALLLSHPDVSEAAIVGIADPKWGEKVKAFVVMKAGSAFDPQKLAAFCAEKLAAYKVPKEFAAVAALPRNASGKVVKGDLRKLG